MEQPILNRWWTRVVPPHYVLATSSALLLLTWQWRHLPSLTETMVLSARCTE